MEKKIRDEFDYYGRLIYEGEYLNGLKNGNGKEYGYKSKTSKNNLIYKFEGNYLNGEKSGERKEYNGNNKLIFEGEFFQGKKNGKGKNIIIEIF